MGYYHGIFSVDPTTGVLTNSSVFDSTFANNHNLTFSSVFAIKSNGDFVFGNDISGDISEFSASGVLVKDYGTLASVRDLEFDKSGNLWAVNDNSTNGIEEFNSNGNLIKTLTGYAASDVAPDNSGGIYVSHNNFSSDIHYFNSHGVLSTVAGSTDGSGQMIYDNYTPPTPEPGALVLLAGPAVVVLWARRRRAKRANR